MLQRELGTEEGRQTLNSRWAAGDRLPCARAAGEEVQADHAK